MKRQDVQNLIREKENIELKSSRLSLLLPIQKAERF